MKADENYKLYTMPLDLHWRVLYVLTPRPFPVPDSVKVKMSALKVVVSKVVSHDTAGKGMVIV